VAPMDCVRSQQVQALRAVVLPFVFRRYLDYAVFDALRRAACSRIWRCSERSASKTA
jgi:glutamine synthetase adenylyltransferase